MMVDSQPKSPFVMSQPQQYPSFPPPGSAPSTWGNTFGEAANVNPYAAPQMAGGYAPAPPQQTPGLEGLWRQGNMLVMHKMATLPPICVKSGQAATQWLKRNLAWHPPWLFVLILVHILLYAVVALIIQKKATIQIGLTDEWMGRRRMRMLIAWGACLGGLAL